MNWTLASFMLLCVGLLVSPATIGQEAAPPEAEDAFRAAFVVPPQETRAWVLYFIGDGKEYTWKETFDTLASLLGRKTLKIAVPWAPARATVYLLARLFPRSPAGFSLDKLREMRHNYWVCDINRARKEGTPRDEAILKSGSPVI